MLNVHASAHFCGPQEDYDVAALVQAIDAIDMKDSFTMGEFAQDIHLQERAEEQMSRANPNYMETQT